LDSEGGFTFLKWIGGRKCILGRIDVRGETADSWHARPESESVVKSESLVRSVGSGARGSDRRREAD
jgi:hypothetical protein